MEKGWLRYVKEGLDIKDSGLPRVEAKSKEESL